MRRFLSRLAALVGMVALAVASAPVGVADTPWFQSRVGNAPQVLSVVATGV